jgi:hypothetical protein
VWECGFFCGGGVGCCFTGLLFSGGEMTGVEFVRVDNGGVGSSMIV